MRPYVDLFLYDLKLMDDARHREVTGAPVGPILANLRALSERGHAIRLRVPVIPGVNDDDESIRQYRRVRCVAAAAGRDRPAAVSHDRGGQIRG